MMRRVMAVAVVAVVAGLAVACGAWMQGDRHAAAPAADATPRVGVSGAASAANASPVRPTHTASPALPARQPSSTPLVVTDSRVPITVSARRTLLVGETEELIVAVGPFDGSGDIAEIEFVVQVDANLLQVRAGAEGDWAASPGLKLQFLADISSAEDRVQVRSILVGKGRGRSSGTVAIVQLQAVAPGATSITVSDVVVKDRTGRSMVTSIAGASMQWVVDSPPAARPHDGHQRRGEVPDPLASSKLSEEGD